MAYRIFENYSNNNNEQSNNHSESSGSHASISLEQGAQRAELPDASFIKDSDLSRDGVDLVLETDSGTVAIEGYFAAEPAPNLVAPDGTTLTPDLVNSFLSGGSEYANAGSGSVNDTSPIGAVQEVSGEVTVTRVNGTVETVGLGTPIYQGDVVETDESGAVNIMFIDETSFAVSEDARLAIDEYVFDASTQSGTSNFSVLKGVFVFTSGLIGRDDPDDVMIDTPSGSIGIRGTIIAGDVNTGEITVIEGAIVLTDFAGNSITLSNQFETARFAPSENAIEHIGDLSANEVSAKFMSVSTVAADLFSSIQDASNDTPESDVDTNALETQNNGAENSPDVNATDSDSSSEAPQGAAETPAVEGEAEATAGEADAADEIIMSDDIINIEPEAGETNNSNDNGEAQNADAPADGPLADVAPPADPEPVTPSFQVSITKFDITENRAGDDVALIEGNFTNFTNISLIGTSQNYYDVVRNSDNELLIKLKPGVSYDAENPYKLNINAQNENGSLNINQVINLNAINVDEAVILTNDMPNNFFTASAESTFSYDFSQAFNDPEGGIVSYELFNAGSAITLDTGYNSNILSSNFVQSTGQLDITFRPTVDGTDFNFVVRATTDTGQIQETSLINFDVQTDTGAGFMITGANEVYSGTDATILINGVNATVFTDSNNAQNSILINAGSSLVKAGGGDDSFVISSNNYKAYGDEGNDSFTLNNTNGKSYGGDGNDTFLAVEALRASTFINGGDGHDTLILNVGGNIDLGVGTLKNIEVVNTENAWTDNVIDLNYENVIDMTDGDNKLIINLDAGDQVNFAPGRVFESNGQKSIGADTYDIFTDGTITLLIDTDGAHNIVA